MQASTFAGKSQDKFATDRGLETMQTELTQIADGVCDGSSSGAKSFHTIVQNSAKHSKATLQKDIWHKEVKILKAWTALMKNKKAAELKSKLSPQKLRWWFHYCAKTCNGDPELFRSLWLGAADHWKDTRQLSEESYCLLSTFLREYIPDIGEYVRCRSTSLVESYHGLANKYIPKRIHFRYRRYCSRKGLATLDWNENACKRKGRQRTYQFRNVLKSRYHLLCQGLGSGTPSSIGPPTNPTQDQPQRPTNPSAQQSDNANAQDKITEQDNNNDYGTDYEDDCEEGNNSGNESDSDSSDSDNEDDIHTKQEPTNITKQIERVYEIEYEFE